MSVKTWITRRSKFIWAVAGSIVISMAAALAYAAGVGGGTELAGLEIVPADAGHVRLRLYGVGVGSTREEVDASPLASSTYYGVTDGRLSKLPGESGTTLNVLPEYDDDGRVLRLSAHYDGNGNWLAARRVLSRLRAMVRRNGGTCDWEGCRLPAGGEYDGLVATISSPDLTIAALAILR
ncbi:hypothetical protein [Anaeromyxobacter oryzae]|uniref:Uncharacterized protein n=1 Tax=Anaeromyxobacter oryzae TaxID=2918170 RepID=A0ABN6MNE4_9BACT|nr:hypothetical protein [Anaeromyxobacter oryzae]BDG01825.1 hypothetical protein AMOR_08210 [Anaeromyxobacter oryzae]